MSECQNPTADRTSKGRFARGNPGGPGNPFNRRTAELRKQLMEAISVELPAIIIALVAKAKAGDVAAIKIALQYGVGTPQPSPDPDRVDVEEWKLATESMTTDVAVQRVAVDGIPVQFATALADLERKIARLETMFPTPAECREECRSQRMSADDLQKELEDERRDYLKVADFRRKWNASWQRGDMREDVGEFAPSANGGNGAAPPSANGSIGGSVTADEQPGPMGRGPWPK